MFNIRKTISAPPKADPPLLTAVAPTQPKLDDVEEPPSPARAPVMPAPRELPSPALRDAAAAADRVRSIPSVLSPSVVLEGTLACGCPLHIEGRITGSVEGPQISVGAAGRIAGEVRSPQFNLQGSFEGTANCDVVSIGAGAIASGTLACRSIKLSRGAVLEGSVIIGPPPAAPGAEPTAIASEVTPVAGG